MDINKKWGKVMATVELNSTETMIIKELVTNQLYLCKEKLKDTTDSLMKKHMETEIDDLQNILEKIRGK